MPKTSTKRQFSKLQLGVFIVAILSFVVAFTGVNYQNIFSYFSETMFLKPDYTVNCWTTPTDFPNGSLYFLRSLSVSSEYLVITSVALKTERPYIGEPLTISLSFENKGKKEVEQPRVVIYLADYLHRVWNVWSKSNATDIWTEGCSLEYHFPSLDQKSVGTWVFYVLLYDDAEDVLTSYEARQFSTTDVPPRPWWETPLYMAITVVGSVSFWLLVPRLEAYLKKRRKKTDKKKA